MSDKPLVSVIIVNWNGGVIFKQCLKSLSKIDYPNWELIVVDNGSKDGSDRFIKSLESRVLCRVIYHSTNVGFANANNQGVELAKGKYVLLLNNDTKVEPDFLSKLVSRMEQDPKAGVIQPKIYLMDRPNYLDNAGSFFTKIGILHHWGFLEKDRPEFDVERKIFSAKGACMLIRKKIIDKIGLFDRDFFSYFEESDFCWRVYLSGYKVFFSPNAKIYHKVGFTIKRMSALDLNYHYYKNRICSLIKNLDNKNLFVILSIHIFISLGISAAFFIKGDFKSTLMIWRALFWNISNLSKTLKKRNITQKMRLATDNEIFFHNSYPVDIYKHFLNFKRVAKDIKG